MTSGPTHSRMASDIWSVADLLRGDYKRHEYGQVILPLTLLRRLDAVMAPTRTAVRARNAALDIQNKQRLLEIAAKLPFYNTSEQDFGTIASDAGSVAKNLRDYINGFSPNVREILARFDLDNQITRLAEREAPVPGRRPVRRHARPRQTVQPRHGLRLRAPDPEIRRGLQ